jgi:hypothetical protein
MTQPVVLPFLMFQGNGSAALEFYGSVFPDAKVRRGNALGGDGTHISPTEVTPKLGKGAQDTWRLSWPYGGRLDKTSVTPRTGHEARPEANQNGGGVHGPAFKPLQTCHRSYGLMCHSRWAPSCFGI